jgi:hypothetical protein
VMQILDALASSPTQASACASASPGIEVDHAMGLAAFCLVS